jgi:hypothetical protein
MWRPNLGYGFYPRGYLGAGIGYPYGALGLPYYGGFYPGYGYGYGYGCCGPYGFSGGLLLSLIHISEPTRPCH